MLRKFHRVRSINDLREQVMRQSKLIETLNLEFEALDAYNEGNLTDYLKGEIVAAKTALNRLVKGYKWLKYYEMEDILTENYSNLSRAYNRAMSYVFHKDGV